MGSLVASRGSQCPTIQANSHPTGLPWGLGLGRRLQEGGGARESPKVTSSHGSRTCGVTAGTSQLRGWGGGEGAQNEFEPFSPLLRF